MEEKKFSIFPIKLKVADGREKTSSTPSSTLSKTPIRKPKEVTGIKTLIPKQLLRRLQIALVQVKVGNTSEDVLKKIHQIGFSLYQAKEIAKLAYKKIVN